MLNDQINDPELMHGGIPADILQQLTRILRV